MLVQADITVNKNMIPFDTQLPSIASGIRLGTAAITTRGMKEQDMNGMVALIDLALTKPEDAQSMNYVKKEVNDWMKTFPFS